MSSLPFTDNGCSEIEMDLRNISISSGSSNQCAQLRIVQPEHGGGSCNCWGVKELVLNDSTNIIKLHNNL